MQELRLVAVSEDGSYLVLATAGRGTRFTLPVDDRLRAAVRGHFSRLGQFEIEVESPLRPKEIQARIRAGETAEEIAESAGIPVERVRWFEGPVLQEREYMAQQAQRVIARRQGDASPGPPLGEMVEERLGRRGVDLEEVEWDSWKCEDSTWRVRLSFFDDGRPHAAEWVFDPRRRQVSPLDEEAARLSSLELEEPVTPTVTPLVPRRPAMKIVSDSRSDVAAEQRREYGADRGRAAEPRRQTVAPHRREYVAPQDDETVAATGPEPAAARPPARQDVGTQATGGYAEPPGQAEYDTRTYPAGTAEAGPETPATGIREPLRPVASGYESGSESGSGYESESGYGSARTPETAATQAVGLATGGTSAREAMPETERETAARAAGTEYGAERETGPGAGTGQAAAPRDTGTATVAGAAREATASGAARAGEPGERAATGRTNTEQAETGQVAAERPARAAGPARPAAEPAAQSAGGQAAEDQSAGEQAAARTPVSGESGTGRPEAGEPVPENTGTARPESAQREQERAPDASEVAPKPVPTPRSEPRSEPKSEPEPEPAEPAAAEAEEDRAEKVDKVTPAPKRKVPVPAPTAPVEPPARPGRRKNSARGKRASVPSWDEIMFGARRPD